MKTIGLLGGMSWESTIEYYRIINEGVRAKYGKRHSAKLILHSFDFEEVLNLKFDVPKLSNILALAAQSLQKVGADCIVICTNTMHMMADYIQTRISIPILSIVDATAEAIKEGGINKVGLLGSRLTMEEEFCKGKLNERHGIEVLIPNPEDRKAINGIIFDELATGNQNGRSKRKLLDVIGEMKKEGAQGIILGCTELPLVIKSGDVDLPLFDTTDIHADYAVRFATAK